MVGKGLTSYDRTTMMPGTLSIAFVCICFETLPLYPAVYLPATGSGFSVSARIDSGHVQAGDGVLVMPANEVASVKGVFV